MAVDSLQLISVFQESPTETPAQQENANTTPLNPNQAQGAAVPQDTVTLTGQAAQGQQTGQDPQQQTQFQETVITFAPQISVPVGNTHPDAQQPAAPQQPRAPQPPAAPPQPPAAVAGAPATATTAANTVAQNPPAVAATNGAANNSTNAATNATTNAASNSEGPQTPQQQLQQLDQTLQQLGIDPNSISLFNRMALLLYANDPAALQTFVQQLQQQVTQQSGQSAAAGAAATNPQSGAPQQTGQPAATGAAATANDNDPAVGAATLQQGQPSRAAPQQTQNLTAANPTIPVFPPLNQTTGTNEVSGGGSNQPPGSGSTASGASVFVQFEELQEAFAATAQDQTPAQDSASNPQGQLLSVTV